MIINLNATSPAVVFRLNGFAMVMLIVTWMIRVMKIHPYVQLESIGPKLSPTFVLLMNFSVKMGSVYLVITTVTCKVYLLLMP